MLPNDGCVITYTNSAYLLSWLNSFFQSPSPGSLWQPAHNRFLSLELGNPICTARYRACIWCGLGSWCQLSCFHFVLSSLSHTPRTMGFSPTPCIQLYYVILEQAHHSSGWMPGNSLILSLPDRCLSLYLWHKLHYYHLKQCSCNNTQGMGEPTAMNQK